MFKNANANVLLMLNEKLKCMSLYISTHYVTQTKDELTIFVSSSENLWREKNNQERNNEGIKKPQKNIDVDSEHIQYTPDIMFVESKRWLWFSYRWG